MLPIVRRFVALFALLGATSVYAQTYTYSIYIDSDNNSATGCGVSLPGGNITGAESVLTATINAGSPPQVAQVTRSACAGGSFGAPAAFGTAAVSVGAGSGGTTSIELGGALAGLAPGATTVRLYAVATSATGSDVLLTTTGAANGSPIVLSFSAPPGGGAIPAPLIGIPAALLLVMCLLLFGSGAARRRLLKRALVGLAFISGIAGAAIFDWNGIAPLATDPSGDSTSGETAIDLRALYAALGGGNLYFRLDVTGDLSVPAAPPVAVADSYATSMNTALTISAPGVLGNDTVNSATISANTNPAHGSLVLNSNGGFIYTPSNNYTGADSFTYTLTNASGSSTATVSISVAPPGVPTVTEVSPVSGPMAGGTVVTVAGTNFAGASAVMFGATAATTYTVDNATQITATAPAGGPGTVDVTVTTPGGTSTASSADKFTYYGQPASIVVASGTPQSTVVGAAFAAPLVVTVKDASNNPVPGIAVTFTAPSSGASASLSSPAVTDANGQTQVTATANTSGGAYIVDASVSGVVASASFSLTNSSSAVTHYTVSAPSTAIAGTAFNFTVTAQDAFNNTVTGYAGTVHFSSGDAQAVLPADSTLTNGTGTFSATLKTAGNQSVTATDTATASINGTSSAIAVSAAAATHYTISAPATATAGTAFSFSVTAQDSFNNTVTGYAGTVHFSSGDAQAVLPADSALTNGTGNFSATLKTAGNQTVTATDTVTASITGTSNTIAVGAAAPHFSVSAPATATAGSSFNFTVTAQDAFNNTVTGYAGTVHFSSGDAQAVLPANATLTNGMGTFSATLKTAGNQTLTATDTVTGSITGTSNTIAVSAAAATRYTVSAPSTAIAGTAFNFTVTAQDAFNNTVTGYAGTVHFTSSDVQSVLPADSALTNGVGNFAATLKTVGNQTLTATDTVTASITGTSNAIAVSAAAATHFAVVAPATATAGAAFSFTVTAQDAFNNTVTSYAGTAHFTSSDAQSVLPADSILTNGTGNFSATLKTAGNQTVTATDTMTASITGTSNTIAVGAAAPHFSVSAPANATAGSAFNFTVTAQDAFNNIVTGYAGTVHFTSGDAQAVLPANATLTNGTGTFSATLKTAGSQTVTATDTVTVSITGTSNTIAVGAAAATHYTVSAPSTAIAGTAFNFTVTAQDAFNNTVTGYAGTVHFTSGDAQAVLPADSTLTNGTGTFSATLKTAGNQTLTATDTVTVSITGTSNTIAVGALAATHFSVSAPTTATAGTAFSFTVTALDQFNNTATGYAGTAHFTSTDGLATVPADSILTNGAGNFSATLQTAGNQTVTATDTVTASITGTSNTIAVGAAAATHYTVSAPPTATAGTAFNFSVTAQDQFNNTVTGYAGTVHFSSGDAQAVLPGNATLTNGTGTFSATLKTAGNQTVTATDTVNASITGTSSTIVVSAATATHFSVVAPATATASTAFSFSVTAQDSFNNTVTGYAGTVHFSSGDAQAVLPADSTLTNGTGNFSATLKTAGNQTVTATDTVTASITGTSNVISVQAPPQITSATSTTFTIGSANAFSITTTGTPTVTSIVKSGTATPAGVTFSYGGGANATLSSTTSSLNAAQVGTTSGIIFTASNGITPDATQSFSLTIQCPTITVSPPGVVPAATYNQAYSSGAFTVSGGTGPYTFSVGSGALPPGVTLASPGATTAAAGTPGNTGTFTFQVTATDQYGCTGTSAAQTINVDPFVQNDSYGAILGNVKVDSTSGSTFTVAANDQFPAAGTTISAFDASSLHGGAVTMTTSGSGIGQFTYDPPTGYSGADSFTYTVNSNGRIKAATVSFTVGTPMIWFVDNTAGSCSSSCDGRQSHPFTNTSAITNDGAATHPKTGDSFFVYTGSGAYTGGLLLLANQKLIGQGASSSLSTLSGLTAGVGQTLPATGASSPTLSNAGSTLITVSTGNFIHGVTLGVSSTALSGSAFGTLTINSNVTINTNGQALNLSSGTLTATFEGVTSTGGTNNISLISVGGTSNFSNSIAGSLSGATGTAFLIGNATAGTGGTPTITYGGTITASAGQSPVVFQHATGGTVTLSGAVSSTANGIQLLSNTGATTAFSGPLTLNTGANAAFTATGGGTVTATNTASTLTTTTGTALNVANTTIGAAGLKFQSITAGTGASGPASGITLTSTGAGGLTVGGTGTVGSGGTIQHTTAAGIVTNATGPISLAWMNVQNSGTDGIFVTAANGFTLDHSSVTDSAGGATDEGVNLVNVTGAAVFTNDTIDSAPHNQVFIDNNNTNMASLTVTNSTFRCSVGNACVPAGSVGNDAMLVQIRGTSVLGSANISGSTFTGVRATGLQVSGGDTATIGSSSGGTITTSLTVQTSTFTNNNIAIDISKSQSSNVTFQVLNNTTITGQRSQAINTFTGAGTGFGGTMTGKISGNVIGTAGTKDSGSAIGDGIRVVLQGSTTQGFYTIDGNTINEVANADSILLISQNGSGTSNTGGARFKVTNNTVPQPSGTNQSIGCGAGVPCMPEGPLFLLADENTPTCALITGNTLFNAAAMNAAADVYLAERTGPPPGAVVKIQGSGSALAYINANNTLAGATPSFDEELAAITVASCGTFP